MKILLVGQAPSKNSDPHKPLQKTVNKLVSFVDEKSDPFECVNLIDRWPGKNAKGDSFPLAIAKKKAEAIIAMTKGRKIIMLGSNVAKAFGFAVPVLTWADFNGGHAAILPHPSGVNRWYNDEGNRTKARNFLKSLWRK